MHHHIISDQIMVVTKRKVYQNIDVEERRALIPTIENFLLWEMPCDWLSYTAQ
jgi:hypothetical protein